MKRPRVTYATSLGLVVIAAIAWWIAARPAPNQLYTVARLETQLARQPQRLLGQTVHVRGDAETVDLATLYPHARPALPHTFALLPLSGGDPNGPQLFVIYQPGQGRANSIVAWLRHYPLVRTVIPPQPLFAAPSLYRVRFTTEPPSVTDTCSVSQCYYAHLVGEVPATR